MCTPSDSEVRNQALHRLTLAFPHKRLSCLPVHAGGLLGLGGGMVTGPLLLELGIHPQASGVCSAGGALLCYDHPSPTGPLHPLRASRRYCLPHPALSLSLHYIHQQLHAFNPIILPHPRFFPFSGTPPLHQISTATSGAMVLFSSSTALVALMASGRLNLQYAGTFSLASMAASLLGTLVMGRWVRSCMGCWHEVEGVAGMHRALMYAWNIVKISCCGALSVAVITLLGSWSSEMSLSRIMLKKTCPMSDSNPRTHFKA